MTYKYYRKVVGGPQKCLSELGPDMKPAHVFTYYKTWVEAWKFLRQRHGGAVTEQTKMFICEVTNNGLEEVS